MDVIVIGGGFLIAELMPELRSVGPWIAAAVLIVVTGIYQWWRWRQGVWMKIDVFKYDQPGDHAGVHGAPRGQAEAANDGMAEPAA